MKTLSLCMVLSLVGTTTTAYGFNIGNITPTLRFPKDKYDDEAVTMDKRSVSN